MKLEALEQIEKNGLERNSFDRTEKMSVMNKSFKTALKPENGAYGNTIIDKGNGLTERLSQNEFGLKKKEYYLDGKLTHIREKMPDSTWRKTVFDDNGKPYLYETVKRGDLGNRTVELVPDNIIKKDNFTAVTDSYGRPILNKVENIKLKPGRDSLYNVVRDDSYLESDQKGHIIADIFGGPASKENVVPQMDEVNLSKFKAVENKIKSLVEEGHDVSYEVKTNHDGTGDRPSSFEFKIKSDGKEIELDDDLKKIYNSKVDEEAKRLIDAAEKAHVRKTDMKNIGKSGLSEAVEVTAITFTVSTIDNASRFASGEITAEEMVANVAKDTGKGAAAGFGVGAAAEGVKIVMRRSGNELLGNLSNIGIPADLVSFGVSTYGNVADYVRGDIEMSELAYNIGDDAVRIAGRYGGAAVGSLIMPPAGTIVGGFVGCAISSEAYKLAVTEGAKGAEILGTKAKTIAGATIEYAEKNVPEKAGEIKAAFNNFASQNNLPFSFA